MGITHNLMTSIDIKSNDEITLFTDDEKVVLNEIDFELEQSNKMRGFYNKLTVFNSTHCYQLIKNKHQRKIKYRIDIQFLNPLPIRQHKIAWKWLFTATPFLLVSLIMLYAGLFSDSFEPSNYFMTVLIGTASIFLICILLAIHRSYDKWIYEGEYGKVKLLELLNNHPDSQAFKAFIDRLTMQIRQAKLAKSTAISVALANELRELRRLKGETVITAQQYESAKLLILKHKGFSNISESQ